MEDRAKALIARLSGMRGERGTLEAHWTEIAEIMSPFRDDFTSKRTDGEKRTSKIYDGTPGLAAENLASGLWGMMTNSANAWFELRAEDDDLNEDQSVKLWLDAVTKRMRSVFAANGQRFYTRVVDLYSDLVHFGTGVFYTADMPGRAELYFSCRHLAECYIAENRYEQVDTVFRCFQFTARQALQTWGDKVGSKIAEAAEKRPDEKFEFLHAVLPVAEWDGKPRGLVGGQGYVGVYIAVLTGAVLEERGFYEFPFQVPRWGQRSRSVYGESPAMLALADAKMAQQVARTTIVAAQKVADPPLLAPDEVSRLGIRTTPGGIIYGGMDPQGRRMYEPLITGANVNLSLEFQQQVQQRVMDLFYSSLLLMVNQPGRTATEVLALQEEKMRLMGPHLGRIQSEFLDPLISRVFGILARSPGALPPAPPALLNAGLKVEYVSPMARQQKVSEAVAVARTLEVALPAMQADPSAGDVVDWDEAIRVVGGANGLPPKVLRTPEAVEARRQQRQQAQAAAAMAEAAPKVAKAAKDGVQAANEYQQPAA